jgi:hypothetical protein
MDKDPRLAFSKVKEGASISEGGAWKVATKGLFGALGNTVSGERLACFPPREWLYAK